MISLNVIILARNLLCGGSALGKFEKVLIASDFDGTLKNDDGIITDDIRSAIAYFIAEGGYFTVCTGRTYQGFHLYDPSYINAPVLLTNGSMAYDYEKNEPVFVNGIDAEHGIPFVRAIMEKFPDVSIEMYPFDSTYAIHLDDTSHRHFTSQGIPYKVVNDPSETEFPWAKAMFDAEGISQEVQTFMRENFDDPAFLPTNGGYIEVMKKGSDKGTGLLFLADALGVPHDRTFAVGDGYNDIEMLVAAKAGFVPENGSPEALEYADYVVRSNNDGAVANVIEILDNIL